MRDNKRVGISAFEIVPKTSRDPEKIFCWDPKSGLISFGNSREEALSPNVERFPLA